MLICLQMYLMWQTKTWQSHELRLTKHLIFGILAIQHVHLNQELLMLMYFWVSFQWHSTGPNHMWKQNCHIICVDLWSKKKKKKRPPNIKKKNFCCSKQWPIQVIFLFSLKPGTGLGFGLSSMHCKQKKKNLRTEALWFMQNCTLEKLNHYTITWQSTGCC